MTKLASWGSVALALAFSSSAIAQTAPDQNIPDRDRDVDVDVDVDADVDRDLDTDTTTTPMQTPGTTTPGTTTTTDVDRDIDLDLDADINTDFDPNRGTGTVTPSTTIDADLHTPPPPPVDTQSTGYVAAPVYYGTDARMEEEDTGSRFSRMGIAIAAGGGTGGFVNDTLRNTTNVGGEWNVRATVGTRSPIAFEGSYIGSAQGINALGLDDDALLVGNGVQGALRLNATVDLPVQPFIYGGAAWRRYSLRNTATNLSDVANSDDVLEIPVGVGVARNADLLPEFGNDDPLIDINNTDSASMNRWGAKASVGFEF
jgi:hypothetical protein